MRLNHLEISGFKSFPERAELAFDDCVTAIVGPNGCGKSNVIDAITWVLGEQSARSLRGERMEDVIFSGSDARRPTAAAEVRLQLSEVTAALARLIGHDHDHGHGNGRGNGNGNGHAHVAGNGNGDGHTQTEAAGDMGETVRASPAVVMATAMDLDAELDALEAVPTIARDVEVGRRLYRSGESEYLIDGHVCRLRDIQDLLMDSGVGIKAYAVIEQGKIGQILGARPMERRQLLEEAAGVTKFKSRRRSAELKLEAAQQNLTRVDDIVFEVEKQRGALKRQAARARRYRRLREDLRRWEKVLFARKAVSLVGAIADSERRLSGARELEQGAAARVAGLESGQQRLRIELAEADQRATAARDAAHTRELELGRRQQQIEFEKRQVETLEQERSDGAVQLAALEERRAPQQAELTGQLENRHRCDAEREAAEARVRETVNASAVALAAIEGLEADVEASRDAVFSAIQSATTLHHVIDNAAAGAGRLAGDLAKLESEATQVRQELDTIIGDRRRVDGALTRVRESLENVRVGRADRDAELATARIEHEWRARDVRTSEHELASMAARLSSLEELHAGRAGYSEAARVLLDDAAGSLEHFGSLADHLEVGREHERVVEAALGELLQAVVVRRHEDAHTGMELTRSGNLGRCGFIVAESGLTETAPRTPPRAGLVPFSDIVRVKGEGADAVRRVLARRWLAPSIDAAAEAAAIIGDPVATPDGTVFQGTDVIHGGGGRETLGILSTMGEIKELRERMTTGEERVRRLNDEIAGFAGAAARAEAALTALQTEEHRLEKELVGLDLHVKRLEDEDGRLRQKLDVIDTDRRQATEERDGLSAKQTEARESISHLEAEQRSADERLNAAQRRLIEARESLDALSTRVSEAKTEHAALSERATALASDVKRLEEATADLEQRIRARTAENERIGARRGQLVTSIADHERQLDADVKAFESLCDEVRTIDDRTAALREQIDGQDGQVRDARQALEAARAEVGRFEVALATVTSDLTHLDDSCRETLQTSLDEVRREIEQLECDGPIVPDPKLFGRSDGDEDAENEMDDPEAADTGADTVADPGPATAGVDDASIAAPVAPGEDSSDGSDVAERVIALLREKIERLGPVNMMAIDQFDELEQRFEFLTTQRQDLLDAIKATGEAIKRIDTTTRERFTDAFTAVNEHFQTTFSTLFGGGRAGLVLLDESDPLESGIDIIAQPPGKRLQSIQLLSGGEKALTAMSLMFAIFKYKPSPFCLLDEIDAPLDDANIGRFVEMLRGMQDHTQFVLVTHNRKTMEIADRLYGVTMEEPGVSKLISVKIH